MHHCSMMGCANGAKRIYAMMENSRKAKDGFEPQDFDCQSTVLTPMLCYEGDKSDLSDVFFVSSNGHI